MKYMYTKGLKSEATQALLGGNRFTEYSSFYVTKNGSVNKIVAQI